LSVWNLPVSRPCLNLKTSNCGTCINKNVARSSFFSPLKFKLTSDVKFSFVDTLFCRKNSQKECQRRSCQKINGDPWEFNSRLVGSTIWFTAQVRKNTWLLWYLNKICTIYVIFWCFLFSLCISIKFWFSERHVLCFRRPLPGVECATIPYWSLFEFNSLDWESSQWTLGIEGNCKFLYRD
jgi:hypothetical protein